MNDHPTPDAGGDENLPEDEVTARDALRAAPVPHLSELERRRLVRDALDEAASSAAPTGTGRSARPLIAVGVAALVVAVTIFTLSLLSDRGDGELAGGGTSGDPAPSLESVDADGSDAPSLRTADTADVRDLGDLGVITDDSELLAKLDLSGASYVASEGDPSPVADAALECLGAVPSGFVPVAAGTLTYAGTDAIVVVGENPAGEAVVQLLAAADCTPFEGWDPRPL